MRTGEPILEKSRSVGDLQHTRLMALLSELMRDKGPREAAQELDIDHRTLTASLESGRLSKRVRSVLEKELLSGGGSPAAEQRERNDKLEGRVEKVEGRVEELSKDTHRGLAAVQGEVKALRSEHAQEIRQLERPAGAGGSGRGRSGRGGGGRRSREAEEEALAPAGVPRAGDPRACRRRRGGVRSGVAADSRVAGAEGQPPGPGQQPVVAGDGGAVPVGGAGAAPGARDDAAA